MDIVKIVSQLQPLLKPLSKKHGLKILIAALALTSAVLWAGLGRRSDENLHIKFYDVGQGDAIFIETPEGHQILVDGGPDAQILQYLSDDLPFHDHDLDLVVLTHPHADHLVGLNEVLKRYQVDQVLETGFWNNTEEYWEWVGLLEEENAQRVKRGDRVKLGEVEISVIWPPCNPQIERDDDSCFLEIGAKNLNLTSTVLLIKYGDFEALLTGDAEAEIQDEFGITADIEVLKVPHQGANDGWDQALVESLKPELAVVSVGKNSFGHPSSKVLGAYSSRGIKTLRTDEKGTVEVVSDGKDSWVTSPSS